MNKIFSAVLLLLVATTSLSSCKKDEKDFNVVPKSSIVFDGAVDKITAEYPKGGNIVLKVGVSGAATGVRIASTYTAGGVAKRVELGPGPNFTPGIFPVSGGAATISIPTSSLRAGADGPINGAASATTPAPSPLPPGTTAGSFSRAANTYVLVVEAVAPDGSTERRFLTVVAML